MLEKIDEIASLILLISLIFKYSALFLQFLKIKEKIFKLTSYHWEETTLKWFFKKIITILTNSNVLSMRKKLFLFP